MQDVGRDESAIAAARAPVDYLNEAQAICRRLNRSVWFSAESRVDPATRGIFTVYKIYRRGMGLLAERSSLAGLVAYLRKQLPPAPEQQA